MISMKEKDNYEVGTIDTYIEKPAGMMRYLSDMGLLAITNLTFYRTILM